MKKKIIAPLFVVLGLGGAGYVLSTRDTTQTTTDTRPSSTMETDAEVNSGTKAEGKLTGLNPKNLTRESMNPERLHQWINADQSKAAKWMEENMTLEERRKVLKKVMALRMKHKLDHEIGRCNCRNFSAQARKG